MSATICHTGLALTGLLIQRVGMFTTIWLLGFAWLLLATGALTIVPYVRRERGVRAR